MANVPARPACPRASSLRLQHVCLQFGPSVFRQGLTRIFPAQRLEITQLLLLATLWTVGTSLSTVHLPWGSQTVFGWTTRPRPSPFRVIRWFCYLHRLPIPKSSCSPQSFPPMLSAYAVGDAIEPEISIFHGTLPDHNKAYVSSASCPDM